MTFARPRRVERDDPPPETAARRRLAPDERERQIVNEAIRFFAEVGFEGQTRELAKRLGVTQPLLYRYFPTKEDLIERVYREVYLDRWKPEWQSWIKDRSSPVAARLKRYYKDYHRTILTYEWVRIFLFAGLRGVDINRRYLKIVRERIFEAMCVELRREFGLPGVVAKPIREGEIELIWGLHASVFYFGLRRFVYGLTVPDDIDPMVEAEIDIFMAGLPAVLPRLVDGR